MHCIALCLGGAAFSPVAHAEGDAGAPASLSSVLITGQRTPGAERVVATSEAVTRQQLDDSINTATTAGVLQYLPSVHVRERYIGDRNAVLVMRVNSSVASAQTTVYADGLLLSNFLNNSFSTAPRWGLVSPEEIERVDVTYGPFSALFPGNSAGGVVRLVTRTPKRFEAHLKLDAFTERFKEYGTNDHFGGGHASVSLANVAGEHTQWSYWLAADHLSNRSHPQTYGNTVAKTGGPAAAGTFTVVNSADVFRDTDTAGLPRTIVSSTGIDHTVQDMGKLKLGLRITPTLSASYSLGIWRNASQGRVDSYLRDASGATVFNASAAMANPLKFVRIDGLDYTLSSAAPSSGSSEHRMHGFALHSTAGHAAPGSLDWELVASRYSQIEDISRSATPTNGYDSALGNPGGGVLPGGQITLADGTGWRNFDWRAVWRGTGLAEAHTVSAGLHVDRYELASITYGTAASPIADWTTSTTGALNTNSFGKTETRALYLQDEFRVTPDFTLTAGARHESWRAFDGSNFNAANTAPNPKTLVYANREFSHLSPKLQLAWTASPALTLRAGFGKAVRYPTVAEMFQTFNGPNNIRTNDPNLQPEQVLSQEWVAERQWETASLRGSLFYEDKRDALISQTDVTVTPNISSIQNVDRLRTHGLELAWQASHVANAMGLASPGTPKIDLQGSVTWTHSVIVANRRNPGLEGTAQPRIPDLRATVVGTWHATDATTLALSWRYSGRQHNALYNTSLKRYNDTNPDVYGAVSHYSVFDAKIRRRLDKHWSAAFGVNNLGNFKYYVNPNPYPQRTLFASLSYDL